MVLLSGATVQVMSPAIRATRFAQNIRDYTEWTRPPDFDILVNVWRFISRYAGFARLAQTYLTDGAPYVSKY